MTKKSHERLEAAYGLIHGSGGHVFLWSLISAFAPPGRTGIGILATENGFILLF